MTQFVIPVAFERHPSPSADAASIFPDFDGVKNLPRSHRISTRERASEQGDILRILSTDGVSLSLPRFLSFLATAM